MHKQYKQYVYTVVVSMLIPTSAQTIEEMSRMKSEYEQFNRQQIQSQINSGELEGIGILGGLPQKVSMTPYILPAGLKKLENFGIFLEGFT